MRVLFGLNALDGGATASACDLIEGLRARGHSAVAVVPEGGGLEARRRLEACVDDVLWLDLVWWNRNYRGTWWKRPVLASLEFLHSGLCVGNIAKIRKFIERHQVDLVHTNTALVIEPALAARLAQVPHVWHVREQIGRGRLFRFWLGDAALVRTFFRLADAVVANSNASAAVFSKEPRDGRLFVIPNSVTCSDEAPEVLRAAFRSKWGVPQGCRIVGMVGNLSSRMKGHELFLRAAAEVRSDGRVFFVVIGKNPLSEGGCASERAYARGLVELARELGIQDRWRLVGFETDVQNALGALDVLVHPSAQEGFGKVVLEAMAAGRPVVAARAGGVLDILEPGQQGYLVEPDSVAGFARAIEALVGDDERCAEMGRAGRKRAVTTFTGAGVAEQVEQVYRAAEARCAQRYAGRSA